MSFDSLGLDARIVKVLAKQGYERPTPIQAQAIPAILKGQDVLAAAQTGTGKTAAFALPLLTRMADPDRSSGRRTRVLVLAPTRELAAQILENVRKYGRNLSIRAVALYGGVSMNPQIDALAESPEWIIATPGRLIDLYNQGFINFKHLEALVLDEADRMLDMGFIADIKKILRLLPDKRQNLLFSATFSGDIRKLAQGLLKSPVSIDVAPRNSTTASVQQRVYFVPKDQKQVLLVELATRGLWGQTLVFTRTKHGANRLTRQLERDGFTVAAIHGDKSQGARLRALAEFKAGNIQMLVATDIAARGLDIKELPHVVNYDLPNVPEDYVHRIGRTGRAGAQGEAVSLVTDDEKVHLKGIERLIGRKLEVAALPDDLPPPKAPVVDRKEPLRPKRAPQAPGRWARSAKPRSGSSSSRRIDP